jgi:hypothetical protein
MLYYDFNIRLQYGKACREVSQITLKAPLVYTGKCEGKAFFVVTISWIFARLQLLLLEKGHSNYFIK